MKRTVTLLGILAVALLLVSSSAMAQSASKVSSVVTRPADEGQMYERTPVATGGLVNMPATSSGGSTGNAAVAASAQAGPIVIGGSDLTGARAGGAIVGPRGGSVYTPKQRADREIRRLIRDLG